MLMEKQKKYCKEHKTPMFVPSDGICWCCGSKIEDTDKDYITGCPHCNRSFCE